MKLYLRLLSLCYAVGALLHVLDVAGLRLEFAEMSNVWKAWIVFLLLADILAAVGLWLQKTFGVVTFLLIAVAQLIAYIGFKETFGEQTFLICFHSITIAAYLGLRIVNSHRSA